MKWIIKQLVAMKGGALLSRIQLHSSFESGGLAIKKAATTITFCAMACFIQDCPKWLVSMF